MPTHQLIRPFIVAVSLAWTPAVMGQFAEPSPTTFKEKIVGQVVAATGTPDPVAGDMIGAFYDTNKVCGRYVFTGTGTTRAFEITLNGDVSSTTTVKEGPTRGQRVTFQFYDASANTAFPMTVLTTAGETFNFTFQGGDVPPIPVPIDLTPSRDFNLRIGSSGGDGDGDGDGNGNGNRYDVNGDGKVNEMDAAFILRAVTGGNAQAPSTRSTTSTTGTTNTTTQGTSSTSTTTDTTQTTTTTTSTSLDVNRDGRIDVNDAIEVIRNKDAG